ncbi:MAG: hypothetical protein ACLQVI_03485 [Polyangiaceae bacterium]
MCLQWPAADGARQGCFLSPLPQALRKTFSFNWPPTPGGETVTWSL